MREMIDANAADAEAFRARLRRLVAETVVDPASGCATEARDGLRRVADTIDVLPNDLCCDLADLDALADGLILAGIRISLLATGGGPTLDWPDAKAVLGPYIAAAARVRKRCAN